MTLETVITYEDITIELEQTRGLIDIIESMIENDKVIAHSEDFRDITRGIAKVMKQFSEAEIVDRIY